MEYTPTVHILLATYNGRQFIDDQMNSILNQDYNNWTLTISDDGSTDGTLEIVQEYISKSVNFIKIIKGPMQGSATLNFFRLINHCQKNHNEFDLYAFCDQDDVWLSDKLQRAVAWHASNFHFPYRLYCGRTQIVDEKLQPIGLSPALKSKPSFQNAIVQNIAGGNTMVMSTGVMDALQIIAPAHSVWHDWSCYLVTSALGGIVFFDEKPAVLYRQHTHNLVGGKNGSLQKLARFRSLFLGSHKRYSDCNLLAMHDLGNLKTIQAAEVCHQFFQLRQEQFLPKSLYTWLQSDIRRQSFLQNLVLFIAIVFKKL